MISSLLSSSRCSLAVGVALIIVVVSAPTVAHAADEQPSEAPKVDPRARAQQLFDSALADAEAGNFAAACPKFLASQEADPKTSTLLNLANCYEKNGQTASAWGAFREAETRARKQARADWESAARTRAEGLEPKLVRLSIVVSDQSRAIAGLSVTRDGAHLASGEWGVAIPVDPGEHTIVASAEGHKSWDTKITIKDGEPPVNVAIPMLEALPATPAPLLPPEPPRKAIAKQGWSTWKTVGAIGAGVGAAGLVAGGLIGLAAKGDYNSARARCRDGAKGCPPDAINDADSAYGLASGATVVFVVGAALLASGAALFIFDPDSGTTTGKGRTNAKSNIAAVPNGVVGHW